MANLRPFRFGVIVYEAKSKDEWAAKAQRAENLGYSTFLVPDHLEDQLAAVPALVAAAEVTSSIRLGSSVFDNDFRHPVMLAKEAATIDLLSGGRFELGLGTGWYEAEHAAYGLDFGASFGERFDRFAEQLDILTGLWGTPVGGSGFSHDGRYFRLRDARCEPRPVQAELPIWVGGGGERKTLRTVARFADGWNVPFVSPEEFARKHAVLRRHCEEVGRDPTEIRCAVNVALAWKDQDLVEQFDGLADFFRPAALTGSDEEARDKVGRYVDGGADQVNIALRAPFNADALERAAAAIGVETVGTADRLSGL